MIRTQRQGAIAVAALSAIVTACGGGGGNDTSAKSEPTILIPVSPPTIASQPVNASVQTDGTTTFTVSASGSNATYQWKKNGVDIPGATSASYTTPAAATADNGAVYTVTVTNSAGTVTSAPAKLTLTLSANQKAFEDLILAPATGSYGLHWNLPSQGSPVKGINYASSDFGVLPASPLTNGPQSNTQSTPLNVTSLLTLLPTSPTRVLKNGVVLLVPTLVNNKVSYVGADVRVDTMTTDGATVLYSEIRNNYETVALTGALSATPLDFQHFHNVMFSNPVLLDQTKLYAAGAAYLKFTQTNKGDRYNVFDCKAATPGADVSVCQGGTTLKDFMTAGITSNSDATTYHLEDGVVSTVNGVSMWVATKPRPVNSTVSFTVQYRIYFELNGGIYTGSLIKDGTVLGGGYYISNPLGATNAERLTFLNFDLRMNKAAHDSMVAAMKF